MKYSVLVPTMRRPELLRCALTSIVRQTRRDLILEVVVSENGKDPSSQKVCEEFSSLPIRYFFHDEPKAACEHFDWMAAQATGGWVAWLADDDMWGRYHLEEADRLFHSHPDAVAYAGQAVTVFSSQRVPINGWRETIDSIICEDRLKYMDCRVWDRNIMFVETVCHTPLNMWGMVFRKDAFVHAIGSIRDLSDMIFDNDRYFLWNLSHVGNVLVGQEVTLFYRNHGENTWMQLMRDSREHQYAMTRKMTRMILNDALKLGMPAKDLWFAVCSRLDQTAKTRLERCGKRALEELVQVWGKEAGFVDPKSGRARHIKRWLPPVLFDALIRLYFSLVPSARK
jgi:glycosyltransferase involved in cell wall biosynthesis